MFFDTHAHYDDSAFDEDRDAVLAAVSAAGVEAVIDPGCDLSSSEKAMKLSEEYDFVYFAAGIHPENLDGLPEDYAEVLKEYLNHPKCVAIGEIGLDYYWKDDNREQQKQVFRAQMALAAEKSVPVIIHDREAHGDTLEIVREFPEARGVFHCFSGSREMAEELLKKGWYLGFDGPVTYKNARKTLETLDIAPLDRILIETDSPYLSPVPKRGTRNDSANLVYIVQKIAEIKGESPETIATLTAENARRLFNIR